MKNILISGAPGTGKSIIANSLSIMTGLPTVSNRPSSEIIYEYNLSRDISTHSFKELFTIGFANFNDRISLEQRYDDGFISDGSILNDLIAIKTFLKEQSKNSNQFFYWISNKRYLKECFKMVESLERLIDDYFKYRSYDIVHLNLLSFPDNYSKQRFDYLNLYNDELNYYYKKFKVPYVEYSKRNLNDNLNQIIENFHVYPKVSSEIALLKALNEMHIGELNYRNNLSINSDIN